MECLKEEKIDLYKEIYMVQGYEIIKEKNYFIATLKYGIATFHVLIIPLIKNNNEEITEDDIRKISVICAEIEERQNISCIHLISNNQCNNYVKNRMTKLHIEHLTEKSLFNKIVNWERYFDKVITEYEHGDLINHYIKINASDSNEPLDEYIYNFICSEESNALLLLGDYGSGKTSFCMNLTYQIAKNINKFKGYIPIRIALRDYKKSFDIAELLTNYFVNQYHINIFKNKMNINDCLKIHIYVMNQM